MAFGIHERPALAIGPHLDGVDYPVSRSELVLAAEEGDAPPEVINVLACLPLPVYESKIEVLRDLGEAERRFASWPRKGRDPLRDRRDIGRGAREAARWPA